MTDPVGVTTCYEYDLLERTSRIYSAQGMEVQYRYDENGNRIEKIGEQGFVGAGNCPLKTTYAYDVRGQLLEERQNTGTESQDTAFRYTYDASRNRISKESPEGTTHYQYNEKNQLVSENGIRGRNIFTYSRGGSIIKEEGEFHTRHFIYNSKNQQVKVTCEDGQTQVNRYDPEGLRYEMKENEKLFRFIYHRGELLYEEGKEEQSSYHLGGGTEAICRNKKIYYYHQNEQLSTALITDDAGEIKNQYQYGAFGKDLERTERISNRIGYTGQQYDGVTNQLYLRARFYNPVLGRFMQEDPYLKDGLNLYAYCRNNPIKYVDPTGFGRTPTDYTQKPQSEWPQSAVVVNNVTGSPNIPTNNTGFPGWFDKLTTDQLSTLYGNQDVKDIIKARLRGGREWNIVANSVQWKEYGLTAGDIMNNTTATA